MIARTLTCLLFPTLLVSNLVAQRNCATLDHWEYVLKKHNNIAQNRALIERHTQSFVQKPVLRGDNNIVIPVVVHVLYKDSDENIADETIVEQIQVLNEDFGRLNPDADAAWPQAAQTGIQFRLANRAPDGTPSKGIRRKYTSYSAFSTYDDVKFTQSGGLDAWPSDQYLNIWVCDLEGDIMGYGQLPGGPSATDGVVIDYRFFGRFGHTQPPFDRGRTTTHEVGHWLNLFHIWGDGDCTIDDMVEDTPDSDGANSGCPKDAYSCGGKLMVQNFMDYTDDACMNLFTQGQARRMQALFAPGGFRHAILNSPAHETIATLQSHATCGDGILNGDETGIDCGGSCTPCASKVSCPVPQNIAQVHSGSKVTLRWETVGAAVYQVEIRQLRPSISKWSSVVTPSASATVSGVRIGRTYEWRVRAICEAGDTSMANGATFTTRSNERTEAMSSSQTLYPNPAHTHFYFNTQAEEGIMEALRIGESGKEAPAESTRLLIKNIQGQLVHSQNLPAEQQATSMQVDVSNLTGGMYFVYWVNNQGYTLGMVHKLIVH